MSKFVFRAMSICVSALASTWVPRLLFAFAIGVVLAIGLLGSV